MISKVMPVIASALSYEVILTKLRDDINKYLENPSEDALETANFDCMLFSTKKLIEETGGVDKLTSSIDRLAQLKEIDDTCNQAGINFGSTPDSKDVTGLN